MFDNLREQANAAPFYEDEAQFQSVEEPASVATGAQDRFLGMSPIQRFIISVMLMMMVCTIGAMFLLVTGKIGL
jgi:ABC-type antimicrobial peptide transport system permease subunit